MRPHVGTRFRFSSVGAKRICLADGRRIRTVNVIDAFTRECLVIEVDTSLPARRVIGVLDKLLWAFGLPESLRVDNGPEFISGATDAWTAKHGIKLDFIQPGKPTQNAHVESFNGRFRDECLAQARFPTLARARVEIELWRVDYNTQRPHSALGLPDAQGLRRCGSQQDAAFGGGCRRFGRG